MRIGTKSFLVLSFKQVGLWFIHPLSSGSSPPLSRLWTRLLRHPAFPLVHQLLLVRTSWYILWSFMYSYVCYADPMERSALKYTRHQLLASLHCWCGAWGDTCGGKLALRAGGRRHINRNSLHRKRDAFCCKMPPIGIFSDPTAILQCCKNPLVLSLRWRANQ